MRLQKVYASCCYTITRQLPVAALVFALLMQTLNRGCIVWSYYVNTAAYAKNCVNKAKPQLHCNGKCQMMKKLKQETKKDERSPERKTVPDEVISSRSFFATLIPPPAKRSPGFADMLMEAPSDRADDFFHPPAMA